VVKLNTISIQKFIIMEKIHAIKPGPKPKTEEGQDDRRRRVDPPNEPKHPDLKPRNPKPKR
jgi:hypothetical protein